jgi:competence protein ComEC
VSLLLGVVFVLARRLAVRLQQGILLAALGVYSP